MGAEPRAGETSLGAPGGAVEPGAEVAPAGADGATAADPAAPADGVAAPEAGGPPATAAAPAGGPAPGPNGGATDVGITATTITLGNVSTLSGPIPGLFQGAVIGSQAFVAYANSQGGVHGRKLQLEIRDDQFDSGQNRAQTQDLSNRVAAFLGSFSTFDDAGAAVVSKVNLPDIGYGLTDARRNQAQNFSPQPGKSGTFRTGGFEYYSRRFPEAVKAMGAIYGDIPASKGGHVDAKAAAEAVGWKYVYERGYQPTESDFTADVIRMRQQGVKGVYVVAADVKTMARLLKAMQQQGFKPEFVALGASGYDANLIPLAGAAAEGVFVDQQLALYQGGDSATVPEVALMNQWVQKVKPGFKPDLFTAFAWASGRLLMQGLEAAGPGVTRQSLTAALQKVNEFDANGLVAPSGPGTKRQAICNMFMQVKNGKFERVDPPGKGYLCGGRIFSR